MGFILKRNYVGCIQTYCIYVFRQKKNNSHFVFFYLFDVLSSQTIQTDQIPYFSEKIRHLFPQKIIGNAHRHSL